MKYFFFSVPSRSNSSHLISSLFFFFFCIRLLAFSPSYSLHPLRLNWWCSMTTHKKNAQILATVPTHHHSNHQKKKRFWVTDCFLRHSRFYISFFSSLFLIALVATSKDSLTVKSLFFFLERKKEEKKKKKKKRV